MYLLFDIQFTTQKKSQVITWIEQQLIGQKQTVIVTPNPEMVVRVVSGDKDFLEALSKADLRVADGIGILWASYFLSLPNRFTGKMHTLWTAWQLLYSLSAIMLYPPCIQKIIPDRISGSDIFWDIVEMCYKHKKRPFFLGASAGIAEQVRDRVLSRFKDIQVAGAYSGNPRADFDDQICHMIHTSKADVVFVAFGAPKQELWMQRNRDKIQEPVMMVGVGGTFDFVSGYKKRSPVFMRRLGLEWLFRLMIEPVRYVRIWNATVRFIHLAWKQRCLETQQKNDHPIKSEH